MSARLSQDAIQMLTEAGFNEVADDFIVVGSTDVRILLCQRAVRDLNAQARERKDDRG